MGKRSIDPRQATAHITQRNLETIVRREEEFLHRRTRTDRIAASITGFAGSARFILLHAVWIGVWALWNTMLGASRRFDPYPFNLLALLLGVEAVLLSTFVLMVQNRMAQSEEEREHLHLQINLLAEQETTKILQNQRLLLRHFGLHEAADDPETVVMSETTSVETLAEAIREQLPDA